MRKVTSDQIRKANAYGLNDGYGCFHTPILEMAKSLGNEGIDLSKAPLVSGYRYGEAPEFGISINHRDDSAEQGLSMAFIDGLSDKDHWSCWIMNDRPKCQYSGILVSGSGSDGEMVILPVGFENFDD